MTRLAGGGAGQFVACPKLAHLRLILASNELGTGVPYY
jgi:hypothetical protein